MFSGLVHDHKLTQRALCLVLCVVAWRGPVPMLHDHEALTNPEVRELHERAFHSQLSGKECLGLHWHFAFPEDVNGKCLPVSDEVAPELAAFACAAASQSMASDSAEELIRTLALGSIEPSMVDREDRLPMGQLRLRPNPGSFLASLLCDVPLTAITGVCLL